MIELKKKRIQVCRGDFTESEEETVRMTKTQAVRMTVIVWGVREMGKDEIGRQVKE